MPDTARGKPEAGRNLERKEIIIIIMESKVADARMELDEEEEIADFFNCCICLDLLYKPVVLPCGHMACFWCVHNSMNNLEDSRCPLCRNAYRHFPSICRTLHFMLLKLYPVACKRREEQILAEEKRKKTFSPQFFSVAPGSNAYIGCDSLPSCSSAAGGECQSSLDHQSVCKEEARRSNPLDGSMFSTEQTKHCNDSEGIHCGDKNLALQRTNENGKQLSVADVLCVACKQMLYHPVALNCGHAYCEACIPNQVNGILRCQVCQCFHPSGHPKVCLEFDHFLEMQFPKEYVLRRESVSINRRDVQTESTGTCSLTTVNDGVPIQPAPTQDHGLQQSDSSLMVHVGAGCDYCGVLPITGDRYRCIDCVEQIGFDLCGDCYNTRSNLPGRFNQQHTPEHRFERVENNDRDVFLPAALSRRLPTNFSGLYGVSEVSENEFPEIMLAGNDLESFIMEANDEESEDNHDGSL